MSPSNQPPVAFRPAPCVVLIVDDSQQAADNLEIALTASGELDVRMAGSALEALELLRGLGSNVGAVITDLEMPRMDGYELIARLRGEERWRKVPIIVLSGSTDPDAPQRVLREGADAFFAKPYSPRQLRQTLTALLEGGHS